jgi:Carotenoid biosynthesis protein
MTAIVSKALWVLIAFHALATIGADGLPALLGGPWALPAGILIPLVFALAHGSLRYGLAGMRVFLVLCLGAANIFENMSVLTGFPFGHYHYTEVMGPKLFLVPLLIGPAYFGTGYLSWVMATILLDTDRRRDALAVVLTPLVATFIMVGWDLCLDPSASTIARIWIWENGGSYFGVPVSNYLGWCLTVFTFLMLFSLWRARRLDFRDLPQVWWYQACALFAVTALDYPASYLGQPRVSVTDATGKVWQTADIYGTASIASLFTVLFVAVAATAVLLLRARRPD